MTKDSDIKLKLAKFVFNNYTVKEIRDNGLNGKASTSNVTTNKEMVMIDERNENNISVSNVVGTMMEMDESNDVKGKKDECNDNVTSDNVRVISEDEEDYIYNDMLNDDYNGEECATSDKESDKQKNNDKRTENTSTGEKTVDDEIADLMSIENISAKTLEQMKSIKITDELMELYRFSRSIAHKLSRNPSLYEECGRELSQHANSKAVYEIVAAYMELGNHYTRSHITSTSSLIYLYSVALVPEQYRVNVSLSARTIRRKMLVMVMLKNYELKRYSDECVCFALCMDETSDKDKVRMGVFARFMLENGKFIQPIVTLTRYYDKKTSVNMKDWLLKLLEFKGIDINKCINFTSDGARNMRGCKNGLTVVVMNDLRTKRQNAPFYIMMDEYITCMAHRLNLCIQEVFMNKNIINILFFMDWFASSNTMIRWNIFTGGSKPIPTPSQTRWNYRKEEVEFVIVNDEVVGNFMEIEESKESLRKYIKGIKINDESLKDINFEIDGVKTMVMMNVLEEILFQSCSVIVKLQSIKGFIIDKYEIVLKLVKWTYTVRDRLMETEGEKKQRLKTEEKRREKLIKEGLIEEVKEMDKESQIFKNYFNFCTEIGVNKMFKKEAISVVECFIDKLIEKFMYINGDDCNLTIAKVKSYDDFVTEMRNKNSENMLFILIEFYKELMKGNVTIPDKFPQDMKEECMKLKEEMNGTKDPIEITKLLKNHNCLYFNLHAIKCILPTSCCVESMFSTAKYCNSINATDLLLRSKVMVCNDINYTTLDEFSEDEETHEKRHK